MWSLGWQETVFIFLLALLIFGPKKLPELGKNLAKGLAEFRKHSSELKATFDREMANIERETGSIRQDLNQHVNEITNYDSYYENSYYDSGYEGSHTESTTQENSTVSASATQGAESSTQPAQSANGQTLTASTEHGTGTQTAQATEHSVAHEPVAKAETAASGDAGFEGKPVARS